MVAFRTDPWWLAEPSTSLRYRAYCRLWAVGSFVHLTLPHVTEPGWIAPWLLSFVGLMLVAWRGCALGWLLSLIGLIIPLFWLEDQLTQSVVLLMHALGALLFFIGPRAQRTLRMEVGYTAWVRVLTIMVYLTAAFHKVNEDFLDYETSCASGGFRLLMEGWGLSGTILDSAAPAMPHLFLLAEISLGALLLLRPSLAIVLGALLHVPLTVVFAPAFAFTLIPGWICFFKDEELDRLFAFFRRRAWPIVLVGGALGVVSTALYLMHHPDTDYYWQFKEGLMWMLLVGVVLSHFERKNPIYQGRSAWQEPKVARFRVLILALSSLWFINAITPYTGHQFHHTGAMLSNLRTDRGCWNHLLMPESIRQHDPYLEVSEARVGPVRGATVLETQITGRLWSLQGLWNARGRWCDQGAGPIHLVGRWAGEEFEVHDLCQEWPFPEVSWPGFRGFQVNLGIYCPQVCIH